MSETLKKKQNTQLFGGMLMCRYHCLRLTVKVLHSSKNPLDLKYLVTAWRIETFCSGRGTAVLLSIDHQ